MMRGWKAVALRVLHWTCYAAVMIVLSIFAMQLIRGVGEVRRGEATPAEMLEQLGDWMTGKQ